MHSHIPEDHVQKTWIPNGTAEYHQFKRVTGENLWLIDFIRRTVHVGNSDLVLDVGGLDGNVGFGIQLPQYVHIVDPDPTVHLLQQPGMFWNQKVQDVDFGEQSYKLIICCHVLGYLGSQGTQATVFHKLIRLLDRGGSLVLFFNSNEGYLRSLLEYSAHVLERGHYDFFDQNLLQPYRNTHFRITQRDVAFDVSYPTFEELARCCWFLFGAIVSDIDACARLFLPKLRRDLSEPAFSIAERAIVITKQDADALTRPTFE